MLGIGVALYVDRFFFFFLFQEKKITLWEWFFDCYSTYQKILRDVSKISFLVRRDLLCTERFIS